MEAGPDFRHGQAAAMLSAEVRVGLVDCHGGVDRGADGVDEDGTELRHGRPVHYLGQGHLTKDGSWATPASPPASPTWSGPGSSSGSTSRSTRTSKRRPS